MPGAGGRPTMGRGVWESGRVRWDGVMRAAIDEARRALPSGDVPIGALVVDAEGVVVGRGHNRREETGDPTAHAEVLALRDAAARLGAWRLDGCTLVVTLEPCAMCAGAVVLARVPRLTAVEIDRDLAAELTDRFPETALVNQDVMTVRIEEHPCPR